MCKVKVNCKTCWDSHYLWDTLAPCPNCEPGQLLQYNKDKAQLKRTEKLARELRKKIRMFEGKT